MFWFFSSIHGHHCTQSICHWSRFIFFMSSTQVLTMFTSIPIFTNLELNSFLCSVKFTHFHFLHFSHFHAHICSSACRPPLPGTPPPDLFLTSLLSFLDLLSIATGSTTTSTGSHSNDEGGGEGTVDEITGERENVLSEEEAEEERFGGDSDLWKTSLLVFGLSAAILFMSYAVCVTAYVVIRFT